MAATGNVSLGNDSLQNYSSSNRSMDNLSAMDISTGNTSRNNRSTNNTSNDSFSEMVNGYAVKGTTTNAGEVNDILSQKGLAGSSIAEKLEQSGAFTGQLKATTRKGGLGTYNIAPRTANEGSVVNGMHTSATFSKKGPGGQLEVGTVISNRLGQGAKSVSENFNSGGVYSERLTAGEAKQQGLPGAGDYTFSETPGGQLVATRGNTGAVVSGVTLGGYAGTTTYGLNSKTGKYSPIYTTGNKGRKLNKDNIKNSTLERFDKSLKGYENLTEGLNKGEFGTTTNDYLGYTNISAGTQWSLGNGAKFGNALKNSANAYTLDPHSFNEKNLKDNIGKIAATGGFSTVNNTRQAGQDVVGGITEYLKKSKGLNKKWSDMKQAQQQYAVEAFLEAGAEGLGPFAVDKAGVKVTAKGAYTKMKEWSAAHPNDTVVDFFKANMQNKFNKIAQLPSSTRRQAFTNLALKESQGAHTILKQYGLKNSDSSISKSGIIHKKDTPSTSNGVPVYKSTRQIKPGSEGIVNGKEYYENMKGVTTEIKNKEGKTVDIPE